MCQIRDQYIFLKHTVHVEIADNCYGLAAIIEFVLAELLLKLSDY
jgi:hypothetical protein